MTPPPELAPAEIDFSARSRTGALGRLGERTVEGALFLSAALAIVITAAIAFVLIRDAWQFFAAPEVSVREFFTGTSWAPDYNLFGVLPLVQGTLMVTLGSALIAVPLGLATAVYLSEFAHPRVRAVLKPAVELLAGIPSIVFGLVALFIITPILQERFGAQFYNGLSATIVLAFMVLPIITSLSEDALQAVPRELRAGALALGATKWEVTKQVVVPAALSGVVAASLLGFSRAIGETMAVTLAAGLTPQWGWPDYLAPLQTMTSFIAQRSSGDQAYGTTSYFSLFAVGLVLFAITFALNFAAQRVLKRYREAY